MLWVAMVQLLGLLMLTLREKLERSLYKPALYIPEARFYIALRVRHNAEVLQVLLRAACDIALVGQKTVSVCSCSTNFVAASCTDFHKPGTRVARVSHVRVAKRVDTGVSVVAHSGCEPLVL